MAFREYQLLSCVYLLRSKLKCVPYLDIVNDCHLIVESKREIVLMSSSQSFTVNWLYLVVSMNYAVVN